MRHDIKRRRLTPADHIAGCVAADGLHLGACKPDRLFDGRAIIDEMALLDDDLAFQAVRVGQPLDRPEIDTRHCCGDCDRYPRRGARRDAARLCAHQPGYDLACPRLQLIDIDEMVEHFNAHCRHLGRDARCTETCHRPRRIDDVLKFKARYDIVRVQRPNAY